MAIDRSSDYGNLIDGGGDNNNSLLDDDAFLNDENEHSESDGDGDLLNL